MEAGAQAAGSGVGLRDALQVPGGGVGGEALCEQSGKQVREPGKCVFRWRRGLGAAAGSVGWAGCSGGNCEAES